MKLSTLTLSVAITLVALSAGCNGTITQPMQNEGTMSANLTDGTEFLAQSGTTFTNDGTNYIIYATDNIGNDVNAGDEMTITVPIQASFPYTATAPPDGTAQVSFYDYDLPNPVQFYGNSSQGNCVITITQTSPTLQGTFHAMTVSTSDTVVLTSGAFNANPK